MVPLMADQMKDVTIQMGDLQLARTDPADSTHVVVSRRREVGLRVQGTMNPVAAEQAALRAGDSSGRTVVIPSARASFKLSEPAAR